MNIVKEYSANNSFIIEGNVIKNVPILGTVSKNGRIYTRAVRESAMAQFEGREIFKNHTSNNENWTERDYDDLIARVINVHNDDDCLRGDLVVSEGHATGQRLLADARAGLSFGGISGEFEVQYEESELRKGKYVVSNIQKVRLLALVPMPATAALHEGIMEEAIAVENAENLKVAALHSAIDAAILGEGSADEKYLKIESEVKAYLGLALAQDCSDDCNEGIDEIKALEQRIEKLEQSHVVKETVAPVQPEPVVQSPLPPQFPAQDENWIKKIRN